LADFAQGAAVARQAADVFVSYKAEDRARLIPLVEALEAEGFSVWWDSHIGGGSHWREDIREHLDAAKCVIVAWTKRSVGPGNDFVCDEAARARRRGAYLPIQLDAVEPPLGFGEIQAISLKGWHGDRSDTRFVSLAGAIRDRIAGEHVAHHPVAQGKPAISRRSVVAGGIGVGTIALAGAGGWLLLKPAPANAKRIAVLPFANLSGGEAQSYFADGIAEELRSALSRVGMEVVGRTSSDAVKEMDAKAAATRLGVPNILTGSVRRSPETIRVNAQLVSGKDGVERWAQTYDRAPGDAIKIQTDIAASVAQALSIALGQAGLAALTLGGTTDSVAQDLLLQARKMRLEGSGAEIHRKSLAMVDAAIARDPNYADAHVLRAIVLNAFASQYGMDADKIASDRALASESANRAREIAPKLGSAYATLAYIDQGRLNLRGAQAHLAQALALSPDDPEVLSQATNTLEWFGEEHEALRLADRYIALDPLNPQAYRRKSQVLLALRRYAQSIETGRKASELAPKASRLWMGSSLLLLGRPDDALREFKAMPADDPFQHAGLALVAARTGDRAGAERVIGRMRQLFGANASYQYAQVYAQLGDKDLVFAELDNAFAFKDAGLIYLKIDPFMNPIRGDPRYAALVGKLNFP
jgi:TolB-like protein/Flp pilus assembly protein TadD